MPTTPDTPPTRSRLARWLGFAVGLALLLAAVWSVTRHADAMLRLRHSAGAMPAWAFVLLLVIPLLNWLLTSCVFTALTRARVAVGAGRMTALIGASWLLNYLPLSPGLFARVAYQKAALGVPVRTSALIVVESVAAGWVVFVFALASAHDATHRWGQAAWCLAWAMALMACLVPRRGGSPPLARAYAAAFVFKSVDFVFWSLKYMLLLIAVGVEATPTHAVALALVAQTASLVPFIGNGLGVREWLVGLVASALPTWFVFTDPAMTAGPTVASGVAADLLGRGAEVLVAVPVGLACARALANQARTPGSGRNGRSDATGGS